MDESRLKKYRARRSGNCQELSKISQNKKVSAADGPARIADVARLAGVSTATVSRALASPDKVSPKALEQVMEAVRASGYTPNSAARNLRTRRTMMVLVVVPNIANPFFAEVLRGIDDTLVEAGYGFVIGNLDNLVERESRYVDLALSGQFDGVLLMNGNVPKSGARTIMDGGLPVVAMCAGIDDPRIPNIVVQDRECGRAAVAYLVGRGHRRLGYISGPPQRIIERERYAGFREGLAEAGLGEADFVRWEGRFAFPSGVQAGRDFLARADRPTGIFAASDEMAIGFSRTVQAGGVAVPRDVSVIGFDGIEYADFAEPILTTFRQPRYHLGQLGADAVLKLVAGTLRQEDWLRRIPVPLVERDSTGVAPCKQVSE